MTIACRRRTKSSTAPHGELQDGEALARLTAKSGFRPATFAGERRRDRHAVMSASSGSGRGPKGFFVTGTDTEVGKTHVTLALVRGLVRSGKRIAAMKPVAAGATRTPEGLRNDDALQLASIANVAL